MPGLVKEACAEQVEGEELDFFAISVAVAKRGGYEAVSLNRHAVAPLSALLLLLRENVGRCHACCIVL